MEVGKGPMRVMAIYCELFEYIGQSIELQHQLTPKSNFPTFLIIRF